MQSSPTPDVTPSFPIISIAMLVALATSALAHGVYLAILLLADLSSGKPDTITGALFYGFHFLAWWFLWGTSVIVWLMGTLAVSRKAREAMQATSASKPVLIHKATGTTPTSHLN